MICPRLARSFRFMALAIDSVLELAFILRAVKVAFRFCDQSAVVDLPNFVAADSNPFSGAARAGVRSNQCPVEFRSVRVARDIIHGHDHVWNVLMNPRATSAIAARPTAGGPPFTLSEPFSAKNAATFSGFWLHHASA